MRSIVILVFVAISGLFFSFLPYPAWGKPANTQPVLIDYYQTWQNFTGYRDLNTFYQNDTENPINVAVLVLKNDPSVTTAVGVVWPNDSGGGMTVGFIQDTGLLSFIVPVGWYYNIYSSDTVISEWNEFR